VVRSAIILYDYIRFQIASDNVVTVSRELGGRPSSSGGWPFGKEMHIVFDHLLTDDGFRRLVAVVPDSGRMHLIVCFRCKVPESRMAEMCQAVPPRRVTIAAFPPEGQ
jgi:hypothetical protein